MSFVGAVRGRYGDILYWNRDIVISSGIAAYGEYFESEVDIFRFYVQPGDAVIDCGANIGAHTMALASLVGKDGAVMAIEPQRPIYQVMCANAVLNGYLNVHPVLAAAGRKAGYKTFIEPDYALPNSYGGYETTPRAETEVGVRTRIEELDKLWTGVFDQRPVAFMKIDVEGSECEALLGAQFILDRDKPVLYIENDRRENSERLIRLLRLLRYEPYWHIAKFYNPNNLTGRADDMRAHHYGWVGGKINGASLMLLAIPQGKRVSLPAGVRKVGDDDEYPPFDGEQDVG